MSPKQLFLFGFLLETDFMTFICTEWGFSLGASDDWVKYYKRGEIVQISPFPSHSGTFTLVNHPRVKFHPLHHNSDTFEWTIAPPRLCLFFFFENEKNWVRRGRGMGRKDGCPSPPNIHNQVPLQRSAALFWDKRKKCLRSRKKGGYPSLVKLYNQTPLQRSVALLGDKRKRGLRGHRRPWMQKHLW